MSGIPRIKLGEEGRWFFEMVPEEGEATPNPNDYTFLVKVKPASYPEVPPPKTSLAIFGTTEIQLTPKIGVWVILPEDDLLGLRTGMYCFDLKCVPNSGEAPIISAPVFFELYQSVSGV
jgi:hypothetical protein